MKDYLQELSSTSTQIDSLFPNNESQLIQPASAPLPPSQLGVFEVGAEGEVEIDFLFDGGAYLGEVGIFSLEGMSMDSEDFATEAANRALKNSQESGYIAISDLTDSAMISGSTPYDKNHNIGKHKIEHSFLMASETQFGIVFAANGSIQDAITNPNGGELIFSLPQANTNQSIQFAQVPGVDSTGLNFADSDTFTFEDIPGIASDNDFNDAIIQIKGATGSATLLDEVINPERDWRGFESGRQVLELVGRQKEETPPIVVNPPVIIEPPDEKPPISIEPPPSDEGGGNDPGDGETGGSNPDEDDNENGSGDGNDVGTPGDGEDEEPQPPVEVEDKAGDTLAEASSVLPSTAGKSFEDFISINDKDYYSFTVGSGDKITIKVDSLNGNLALDLRDSDGSIIDFARSEDKETIVIEETVEGGNYNLIVTSNSSEPILYKLSIATDPMIEGITTTGSDEPVFTQTQESLPLIGADRFGQRGDKFKAKPLYPDVDGSGYSAVVIDTGLNLNHPAFGSDSNNDGISDRIKYQYDFADYDSNADESNIVENKGHGTLVSSIIASEDSEYPGVAPSANIIPFKYTKDDYIIISNIVYSDDSRENKITAIQKIYPDDKDIQKILNEYSSDTFSERELLARIAKVKKLVSSSYVELALQEIIKTIMLDIGNFNIVAVNMSFAEELNINDFETTENLEEFGVYSDEIKKLTDLGVIVIAGAGNEYGKYQTPGLGYPAADPNAIAVGAVYDGEVEVDLQPGRFNEKDYKTYADKIAAFSQRSRDLPMIFAPGGRIKGAGLGDDKSQDNYYHTTQGTSQAAPHITGMTILTQQLAERELGGRLTLEEMRELLIFTGDKIKDKNNDDDNVQNTDLVFERANMATLADVIKDKRGVQVAISEVSGKLDESFVNPNDKSDFFARITIGNETLPLEVTENQNIILPHNWVYTKGVSEEERTDEQKEEVEIKIELFDKESIFTSKIKLGEQKVDINPNEGVEEINLRYNTITGNIYDIDNDKNHFKGEEIIREGDGSGKAAIKFTVNGYNLGPRPVKKPLTVNIQNIKDKNNPTTKLFSQVLINKESEDKEGTKATWFPKLVEQDKTEIPIEIKVANAKDINNSNLLDINPNEDQTNLNLIYNQDTKEIRDAITGQVYGNKKELITLESADTNISFSVI